MKLPAVPVQTDYTKFIGGLDLVSPALSIKPGNTLAAMNYEPGVFGGYPRIDGFERKDGRTSPSDATYHYATVTLIGTVAVGNTITGNTSAATGVVVVKTSTEIAITKVVGTFVSGETFTISAVTVGTLTSVPLQRGYADGYSDAVALAAAADNYRADIGRPTGSGEIRGVCMYKGSLYAFRDNAGATAGGMWKETAGGWTAVTLFSSISFGTGTGTIADGNSITGLTSGAVAIVRRAVLQSGAWGSNATGRLIISSIVGTFQSGESLRVGGVTQATSTSLATAITLPAGGHYEFDNYNFTGSADTLKMYGANGVGTAFEFDGTTLTPIVTGMTPDTPSYVKAHKKQLFLSFRGSSQNSGIGTPYQWTPVTGAAEIGVGDAITGYQTQTGDSLAIFSRNSTNQLQGSSVADFVLSSISPETGGIGHTAQNIGVTYALDDRGIIQISSTQAYGNFTSATVSRLAQPVIDAIRSLVVASSVYKTRNQYRLYGNDGSGVIMTIEGTQVVGITQFQYPVNVSCACSGEDSAGKDVVFFGADNGYVYQADKGSSFDGEAIEAYLRMPFNNMRSPRSRKRYRKAVLEMTAVGYSSIRFQPEFTYGDSDIASHVTATETVQGAGGYWDVDDWETFYYDARSVSSPEFGITGTGLNMSGIFYSNSAIDLGHTLQGILTHYTPRRLSR